jgi:hypothetical protein
MLIRIKTAYRLLQCYSSSSSTSTSSSSITLAAPSVHAHYRCPIDSASTRTTVVSVAVTAVLAAVAAVAVVTGLRPILALFRTLNSVAIGVSSVAVSVVVVGSRVRVALLSVVLVYLLCHK